MTQSPTDQSPPTDLPDVTTDVGKRSVQAGFVALGGQFLQFTLMLGAAVVLARLLTPRDFGIVAMGMTVIEFSNLVLDFGMPSSVVYQRRVNRLQIDTLFWFNVGFATILAGIVMGAGSAVAWLYSEPLLVSLMPFLATSLVFSGLSIQHEAVLRRQFRFGTLASASVAGTVSGVVVSVAMALAGAGYWALAAHTPVEMLVRSSYICIAGGWRPGRPRMGTGLWPLIRYGGDVMGNRLVNYFGKSLDRVLISVFSGASAVGLYSLADRWAYGTHQMVFARLMTVALAGFSRVRDDVERYRDFYRRGMRLLWTFMFPIWAGVALEARSVMLVLAGDQWGDAAPVLRWMALAALALSVKHVTKWTFMAEGRTRTQLVWSAVEAVITASCVGVGATFGVTQVAMAYALATVALTPITFAIWLRESPIRWPDVGAALSRPAIAVLAMTVAWLFLPVQDAAAWKQLGFAVAVLAPVYIGTWILLPGRRSALRELTDIRHAFNR